MTIVLIVVGLIWALAFLERTLEQVQDWKPENADAVDARVKDNATGEL